MGGEGWEGGMKHGPDPCCAYTQEMTVIEALVDKGLKILLLGWSNGCVVATEVAMRIGGACQGPTRCHLPCDPFPSLRVCSMAFAGPSHVSDVCA